MSVQGKFSDLANAGDDRWSQGYIGDEMSVHDIDVKEIRPSSFRSCDLLGKVREVCGKN
jgi:hypothetical protein